MVEDTPLQQFLIKCLYSLSSIFPATACIDKLHDCVEGIYFNVYQGNMKKAVCHVSRERLQRGKMLRQ